MSARTNSIVVLKHDQEELNENYTFFKTKGGSNDKMSNQERLEKFVMKIANG